MFRKSKVDVLVVGAGPVGLYTALRLVRQGLKVRIIDRASHVNLESYALALHPSSLAALAELGLVQALLRKGRMIDRVVYYEDNQPIGALSYKKLPALFEGILVLPQSELERQLVGALLEAKVVVAWGQELLDIERTKRGFAARVTQLAEFSQGYAVSNLVRMRSHDEIIDARFVVGADGALSAVRRIIGAQAEENGPVRQYVIVELELPHVMESEVRYYFGKEGASVLWLMDGPGGPLRSRGRDLLELLAQRAPDFPREALLVRWSSQLHFRQTLSTSMAAERIWLAGDAAHHAAPLAVRSMNFGLMEASYLCAQIAEATDETDFAAVAKEYDLCMRNEWNWTLDEVAQQVGLENADPWLQENVHRLVDALPATGGDLKELLGQIQALHVTS